MRSDYPGKRPSFFKGKHMKKTFLAGLVILLPLALTLFVIFFLVDVLTDPFLNIVRNFLVERQTWIHSSNLITILARFLILTCLICFIFLLGLIAKIFFFRWILNLANKIFSKIPLIKPIYKTSKDVISALFKQDGKKVFKQPLMIPFPSDKSFVIGFEAGKIPSSCQRQIQEPLSCVFVPTAPHPISGYILMVPQNRAHLLNMSNEEAVKFTVSCGVILPEGL